MEFSNNDLPERQWPSIAPAGADSLASGDLAMDLPVEQANSRKALLPLITFCQAGHYTRLHYKQDVSASRPVD